MAGKYCCNGGIQVLSSYWARCCISFLWVPLQIPFTITSKSSPHGVPSQKIKKREREKFLFPLLFVPPEISHSLMQDRLNWQL